MDFLVHGTKLVCLTLFFSLIYSESNGMVGGQVSQGIDCTQVLMQFQLNHIQICIVNVYQCAVDVFKRYSKNITLIFATLVKQ